MKVGYYMGMESHIIIFNMKLTINVAIDISPLMNVNRYVKKNQSTLLKTAANRYLTYLRNRYISLSSGSGEWPPLAESTIKRKKRRIQQGYGTANPESILRETDTMLDTLGIRTRGKYVYVGYVREKPHPRGPSVNQLVNIHANGGVYLPSRNAMASPNNSTRIRMVEDIRDQYNKVIRQNRKK